MNTKSAFPASGGSLIVAWLGVGSVEVEFDLTYFFEISAILGEKGLHE